MNVGPCGSGYYSIDGDGECQQAVAGKYAANADSTGVTTAAVQAVDCPMHTFSAAGASSCTPCGTGYATAAVSTVGSDPQTACLCDAGYGRSTGNNELVASITTNPTDATNDVTLTGLAKQRMVVVLVLS